MNERVYPAGTGTYSKGRSQFPGIAPRFATSGIGSKMSCSDGKTYIDWTGALGAIVLGHYDPDVTAAVYGALLDGNIFGLPHQQEFEYAERLAALMPWPDAAVRFGKHGSDATTAAVRAARYLTGRNTIVSHGYHGWHDWGCPNPNGTVGGEWTKTWDGRGLPDYTAAAVIVEPDGVEDLVALREWCSRTGAMLIFDEVLTGYRMPGYLYAKYIGVTPDYICLAKAISNGIPLSAVAGSYDAMRPFQGDIGFSFTYGGELTGIAAGIATLDKFQREPVITRLWYVGGQIRKAWQEAERDFGISIPLVGLDPRLVIKYASLEQRTLLTQELWRRGVAAVFGFCALYAHTEEDIERTAQAIRESLAIVARAEGNYLPLIEGPVVGLPYRAMVTL